MAATARSVCASAPNIPIIADAGKVFKFGNKEILKNARNLTKTFEFLFVDSLIREHY